MNDSIPDQLCKSSKHLHDVNESFLFGERFFAFDHVSEGSFIRQFLHDINIIGSFMDFKTFDDVRRFEIFHYLNFPD